MRRGTRDYALGSIGIALVLIFALFPVLWIISLSLKTPESVADGRLIPAHWTLDNYKVAVRGRVRQQPVPPPADQLDRDRADLDRDRDHARRVRRLRDRPPRLPRQDG